MAARTSLKEVSGTWWTAERPDLTFYGRLLFGDSTPRLELEGVPPEDDAETTAQPRPFFGDAFGTKYTLNRVLLTELQGHGEQRRGIYRAQSVIEGCHVDPKNPTIRAVLVRFAGLERWIGDKVFWNGYGHGEDEDDVIRYRPGPDRRVTVSGQLPGLLAISNTNTVYHNQVGSRTARIVYQAHIAFSAIDNMTLDQATSSIIFPLEQMMSMLTDRRAVVQSKFVQLADEEPYVSHAVYDEKTLSDADDTLGTEADFTRLPDVGLGVFATWLLLAPRYREIAALATAALHGDLPVQSSLIAATAAAEGLHRVLFANDRELDRTKTRALRKKLLATAAEHRDIVERSLRQLGEPSLRARLSHLARSLGPAMGELVSDSDAFGIRLAWFRNRHSHLLDDEVPPLANHGKEDAEWIAQVTLTRICARIVTARLLMLCGCDAQVLRDALNQSEDVRTWKWQARDLMPDVVA